MSHANVFLCALILIGLLAMPAWSGLLCYNCNSRDSPKCGEPFSENANWRVGCDPDVNDNGTLTPGVCVVVVTSGKNMTGTTRLCSWEGPQTCAMFAEEVLAANATVQSCRTCTSDLCNHGTGLHGALSLALVLPLLLLQLSR